MSIALTVNGTPHVVDTDSTTPLLWVLRESLGLTGTKFGCGIAQCGACTVILNGDAVRSCVTPVARAEGKSVTTIEGLSPNGTHPVQQAWLADAERTSEFGEPCIRLPASGPETADEVHPSCWNDPRDDCMHVGFIRHCRRSAR